MKFIMALVVCLIGVSLAGCQAEQKTEGQILEADNVLLSENSLPLSTDALSLDVCNAVRDDWVAWNRLSQERKMLSSHMPGFCQRGFEGWADCETFLGIAIPNPLENCSWLEKATFVGMPVGFHAAPRVQADWSGTESGHVDWIDVQAGYRDGQIRVMIDVTLSDDPAELKKQGFPDDVDDGEGRIGYLPHRAHRQGGRDG